MFEMDFEDFVEEIKFLMTEYEDMEEETILDWEEQLRIWVMDHKDKRFIHVKNRDDIKVFPYGEEELEELAEEYHKAIQTGKTRDYWKKLSWGR